MTEVKGLLPERRRLIGSRRRLVVTVHIVAALSLLGTSTVLAVGGVHAARGDDPQDAHAIYSLLRQLTLGLDLPLAAITLFSGVALALTSKWRIFRYWWVTAKLALYLLVLGLGVVLIGPSIDTMLDVTSTSNPGESSARVRVPLFAGVQVALLLAAATLGVFKPERRIRRPQLARPLVLGKK